MIGGLIIGAIGGLVVGWFFFPRPQWAVNLMNKITGKSY